MKKHNEFKIMYKDASMFQYVDGVPATAKKQYWHQSPWDAFRLLLRFA